MQKILIPTGEPAGIGPDICLMLPAELRQGLVFMGDGDMLSERAKLLGLKVSFSEVGGGQVESSQLESKAPGMTGRANGANVRANDGTNDADFRFIHLPINKKVTPGKPDAENNPYLLGMLKQAVQLCMKHEYTTMVTAPVSKQLINKSIPFIGLSELLQETCSSDSSPSSTAPKDAPAATQANQTTQTTQATQATTTMLRMFCGKLNSAIYDTGNDAGSDSGSGIGSDKELRVTFATMHIPVNEIANKLSPKLVERTIRDTNMIMQKYFNCNSPTSDSASPASLSSLATSSASTLSPSTSTSSVLSPLPRLALCGLNPHAGEERLLGEEEAQWMTALARRLQGEGINVSDPLAADSLFAVGNLAHYDAVIAMFHDQGLTPFKALTFNQGAQLTFGLPFLRLSPDHGTAFSLAGSGKANSGSMEYAVRLALKLHKN